MEIFLRKLCSSPEAWGCLMTLSYLLSLSHGPHSFPSAEDSKAKALQLTSRKMYVMYFIEVAFLNIDILDNEIKGIISPSPRDAVSLSPRVIASDQRERGNLFCFQLCMRLLRSCFSLAMTLWHNQGWG